MVDRGERCGLQRSTARELYKIDHRIRERLYTITLYHSEDDSSTGNIWTTKTLILQLGWMTTEASWISIILIGY